MNIRQMLVSPSKYNIKCPYSMNPTRIVVHNTYNDASANNEISYMINNNNQTSFHFAVDDKEVVQGIPLNRNAWHSGDGNGKGNREGIAIEICYSKSGGERFLQAEKNACKLIAQLLRERGWGIDKVTKHQDYANKYCPHRTLDMGWERFLNMVRTELGQATVPTKTSSNSSNKGGSIVDYLKSVGIDSSFANRSKLAKENGISGYTGTASQNIQLLNILKNKNNTVSAPVSSGSKLHLPASATSWRVYPLNKKPVKGNECGYLKPSKFGGLTYDILRYTQNNVAVIRTRDFGEVQIYVAPSTGATIS